MRILKYGSRGNDVKIVQSILNNVGYGPLAVDGVYGYKTENAVREFQQNNFLDVDGIVGLQTWGILEIFLKGYEVYRVEEGDSYYTIAKKFYTNPKYIQVANPEVDPNNLQIGQFINVPYGIDIVLTDVGYTHELLKYNIEGLKVRYPFLEFEVIGKSSLGRELYAIKIGNGPNKVIYNAAHHSLEWITSTLLMKFTENMAKGYVDDINKMGYSIRDIYEKATIYIVPMVNPDGIDLVINGISKDNPNYDELIKWNGGSEDFSNTWQANNRGVDLNHNYNAGWEEYQKLQEELGITGPAPTKYSGEEPESEPESKALVEYTRKVNPRLTLAYHSQGEVIYWQFENLAPAEARRIGELLAKVSGYELDETYGTASYTGYKDWFIQDYRRPGYTIEVGKGKNPLSISQFPKIYNDNLEMLILASII